MEKDTSLLASISGKFTEETLREIFVKLTGDRSAEVTGWNVGPAAAKGDNYLSVVHRVTVNGRVSESDKQFSIIVKALPTNQRRNEIFRSKDFFKNETAFYTKVVPLFEEFLYSKGKTELLNVPKCFAYVDDGMNNFLALEDLKTKGFDHIPRRKIWRVEDCQILLKAFAQYHGIGLALWHQGPEDFISATNLLTETILTDQLWSWYGKFYTSAIDTAQDAISKVYAGASQEKKFNSLTAHEIFSNCIDLINRKNKGITTVCHGDAWSPNFMIRHFSSGEQDAAIFDFQLARCGSPIHDVSFFIYATTDKETRDKYFYSLLKYYHAELCKTVTLLGSNIDEICPYNRFMHEVKEQFFIGFAFALKTIPAIVLPESEAFDADQIGESDDIDIADIWKLKPIVDQENLKRLADVIVHAIDEGFL